jgi:alpha-beta hydrolase superfamily lysophospholipase
MSHDTDISFLDIPEILEVIFPVVYSSFLFGPPSRGSIPGADTYFVEVEEGIKVSCGLWTLGKEYPTILYFHGNGEEAGDYEMIAKYYHKTGVNLFVADYRGYGLSNGKPTITNLVADAHKVFREFKRILVDNGYSSSFFLMGRSLGSISVVEIAYHYQDELKGLIIESGSANNLRRIWGFLAEQEKEKLTTGTFLNRVKIQSIAIPTLIIHGEYDQILPVQEGLELYQESGSQDKDILVIPGADHNDLMMRGQRQYFDKISKFIAHNS